MPKCNYCDREVLWISQEEIKQGWGRVVMEFTNSDGSPGNTEMICHCPDHVQQAFDDVILLVARAHDLNAAIRLKESIPLCGLIAWQHIEPCGSPEGADRGS